ncbi:MAG TPA: glycosyltransferase family 1 protein, partial [Burkholderiales bacterium]|nr:glycosyltransferase family 1 protein [Burkholderiales bacterium]
MNDSGPGRRLRILTWHVHGNYLYYLSQVPHDFFLVTKPGYPPLYAGVGGRLPWGSNVHEVPIDRVGEGRFDCVLYQHRTHYDHDRLDVLTAAQRR